MARKVKGVTNDNQGTETTPGVQPDLPGNIILVGFGGSPPSELGVGGNGGSDSNTLTASKPPSVLAPYTYTRDGRAVSWRMIRLRGKPYLLNTEAEVFAIDLVRGWVSQEPVITRRMDGSWTLEPTRPGHKPMYFSDTMARELERAYKETMRHFGA